MQTFDVFRSPIAVFSFASLLLAQGWAGGDVELAPADFKFRGARATFVDLLSVKTRAELFPASELAVMASKLEFETVREGYPLLNVPYFREVSELVLDGQPLDYKDFVVANVPGKTDWSVRALPVVAKAGRHVLNIRYSLGPADEKSLSFANKKTVELFTGMDDFFTVGAKRNQGYAETLFPTNLQYDPYAFVLSLKINGSEPHLVKTNGNLRFLHENEYEIVFPKEFTTNSFFVHVLSADKGENQFTAKYQSLDGRAIPIQVYCDLSIDYCGTLVQDVRKHLGELEARLGPYPYEKVLYRHSHRTHAMEYAGAFTGSPESIRHELAHNWYGRGVKPARGRDGWLDEAVATWCEKFERAKTTDIDPHVTYYNLLDTDQDGLLSTRVGYGGARLFEKLDKVFESHGGVAPLLAKFHRTYRGQVVTTAQFLGFMRAQPGWSVQAEVLFRAMVFGRTN